MQRIIPGRIVLVLMALVLGTTSAMMASGAFAQSPPNPPARFAGTVRVNGQMATAGTPVEARINGVSCGVTSVFMSGAEARYVLDTPEANPGTAPGCGTDGATVTFLVGGVAAAETGTWRNYQLNVLNLTAGGAATTPTTVATATATRPAATPGAPSSGTSLAESQGSDAMPLFIASGLALIAGAGAVAVRARSSR